MLLKQRSNPLNFFRLFTNGRQLRQLAFIDALGAMTNAQATQQIEMVQRTEQFGKNDLVLFLSPHTFDAHSNDHFTKTGLKQISGKLK